MRLSAFFMPTLKDIPAEAQLVSHRLMVRAGMIRQVSAGIYTWLPLGLRVLRRIEAIVREEQNRCGALEILMPTIQPADLWRESGRYDDYGEEMLRISDRHGREMLYGPTNEELITEAFRAHVRSYKQLPLMLYHIQWKFRDEVRPRFGVMRGREFLMKDAYSFDETDEDGEASYRRMYVAYLNTFARLGLRAVPLRAETGPIGGDLSHEFAILADSGESLVHCDAELLDMPSPGPDVDFDSDLSPYVDKRAGFYSAADDMHDEAAFKRQVPAERRFSARGIEVGHIFHFGAKYSEPMKALITDRLGASVPVRMGSYGIGISRLVGAIIEASHDEDGIVWPHSCAPFGVGVVNLRRGDASVDTLCELAYAQLAKAGVDPLYDDSDERAGVKLSRIELIGLPYALVVGPRSAAAGEVEVRRRCDGDVRVMPLDAAIDAITAAMSS